MKKTLVLVWDYSSTAKEPLRRLLDSPLFDVVSFARSREAIDFLKDVKKKPHAVVLPDCVPVLERMNFLYDFRQEAPGLFYCLPVLLISNPESDPAVELIKTRLGSLDEPQPAPHFAELIH
ncbi:MAG: hypothetical protein EOP11_18510 [Proteobacteria bacterium]|nr:MAG: hypothetical protein EOP11_18510 [Pseudomonadota bacterium]